MADGTLIFDTKVDENGVNKGLENVGKTADSSGGTMASAFKTGLGVLTGNLMTSAVKSVVNLGKKSVEVGANFEAAMSQVAATLGYSVEELNDPTSQASANMETLTEKAEEMGRTTKFTASESAEALNILAMSGFSAQKSIAMVDDVLNLASAGGLEMADAASYIGTAMKGFGDNTKSASYYADLMAKGATKANTNVNQLGAALSGASATARGYSQSADTVTIALLELAEQGETGEAAATMLNRAMADLFTPTDNAAGALAELGVSAYDSSGKAKDFNELVRELEGSLSGMSEEQKNAYLNTIFTTNGLQAFNKITATSVEQEQEFAEALDSANGSAATQADTMNNNLKGSATELGSAIDGLCISLYNYVSGPLTSAVDFFTNTINGITDLISPQKDAMTEFLEEIQAINDQAEQAVENSKETMSDAQYDVSRLETYRDTLLELNAVEDKNEYQKFLLKKIVNELSGDIPELVNAFEEETGALNLTNAELEKMFQNSEALIMQKAFEEAKTQANKGLADATLALSMAESERAAIIEELTALEEENAKTEDHLAGGYGDLYDRISSLQEKVYDLDGEIAQANATMVNAQAEVNKVTEAEKYYQEQLEKNAEATENQVGSVNNLIEHMSAGAGVIDTISQAINGQQDSLIDLFTNAVAEANEAADAEAADAYYIGENMIYGIQDGVESAASDLVSSAVDAVVDAWNAMCSWLDINSPSRKARDFIGANWAKGIGIGFEDEMENVSGDMTGSVGSAFNDMQNAVNNMESGAIGDGMISPINADMPTQNGFDYNRFAEVMIDAISRIAIDMDGQRVANVITDYVDENMGTAYRLNRGGAL